MPGIYIHIPFCRQACSYCDFYFITRQSLLPAYVDRLCSSIKRYQNSKHTAETVDTLYIGGGTPSLLKAEYLHQILGALQDTFELNLKEFTFEINPDDVSSSYLAALKDAGVTRPSMGIQSFHPELLQFMHRAHNREEAIKSLKLLTKADFPTFSVDLIYGNPGQTVAALKDDIDQLLSFHPPHISAYSLTIEPQTRLGKQYKLGRLEPLDEDTALQHYDVVVERLNDAGILQYEISNYSRPGHEAVHNRNYWLHKNYLGFGPAAHSFWWEESAKDAKRWHITESIREYLSCNGEDNVAECEILTNKELAEERIMLGLRTHGGVSIKELNKKYGYQLSDEQFSILEQLMQNGRAEVQDDIIRLTHEGRKIADTITVELLTK